MIETTFDPLVALRAAQAAGDTTTARQLIEEALSCLEFTGENDYLGEARWVLTHLGRLLAAVGDELEADPHGPAGPRLMPAILIEAASEIESACNHIDAAIEILEA